MRSSHAFLAFASLLLLALPGCTGGGACVLDSDCADFTQVCVDQRCVPAGSTDAGRRDGGRADAGRDAGTRDSGSAPEDAGGDEDGGAQDAGADPICPDVSGAWTISVHTIDTCGAATVGFGVTITGDATACEFTATSTVDSEPALDGTFSLSSEGNLSGTMDPGGSGTLVSCTGTLTDEASALSITCGDCTLELSRI